MYASDSLAAMISVSAVKKMHKRTEKKYEIRQRAEEMRLVLRPEIKCRYGGKADESETAPRF